MNTTSQLTPPRGGRPRWEALAASRGMFQLTPPRGGRQVRPVLVVGLPPVSTHAPARGATRERERDAGRALRRFNSRPREGGDERQQRARSLLVVSTHAPARGATRPGRKRSIAHTPFQLTPPRGGRRAANVEVRAECGPFQLTPPRGGRLRQRTSLANLRSFNSRPREGGDYVNEPVSQISEVSTHAPARGATVGG